MQQATKDLPLSGVGLYQSRLLLVLRVSVLDPAGVSALRKSRTHSFPEQAKLWPADSVRQLFPRNVLFPLSKCQLPVALLQKRGLLPHG